MSQLLHERGTRLLVQRLAAGPADRLAHPWRYQGDPQVTQRKRVGGSSPKTRAELYEIARKRGLPGRSKMGRDELARKLGEN